MVLKSVLYGKKDYRIFKLTRIMDLEVLADGFHKSSFPELDETSGRAYNTIVLRFPEYMSYRVYDEFDKMGISKNEDYCKYCFENGAFTSDCTMDEMIEFCIPHMVKAHSDMTENEARSMMKKFFPTLKRWKTQCDFDRRWNVAKASCTGTCHFIRKNEIGVSA